MAIPTTLPTAVSNIKSLSFEYSRPNKYVVQIFVGATNVPLSNVLSDEILSLSCQNAVFPDKNFTTVDDRRGNPHKVKIPYDVDHSDVTFTFQINSLMTERDVIESWMNYIYDEKTESFALSGNYVTDIHVIQFNQARVPVKHIKLIDAYPISMSEIALGYDMNDQISTFSVTFTYERVESHSLAGELINGATKTFGGA